MITHIAVIEFAPGTDDAVIRALVDDIRALADVIPSVQDLAVGVTSSRRLGLSSRFATQGDLDAYLAHPAHVAIGARINEVATAKAGADFASD